MEKQRFRGLAEWPTLALAGLCYGAWGLGSTWLADLWLPLGVGVTALAIVLHSSLSHEVIHGHPFRNRTLSAALVFPALSLCVPYLRFRDTHLAHHRDAILTDPYDDPESNYLDPGRWERLPRPVQAVLGANNTLAGRLLIGPVIGQAAFMAADLRAIRSGDRSVLAGWLWHIPAVALVLFWLRGAAMPVPAYLLATYIALSILKIRTFLEHQAHERVRGRTVIIEDRGPLAFLFLNNNLHVVHHMHPAVPWYRLPRLYAGDPGRYLGRNEGYRFRSYAEVFRRFLFRAKDPVPHPLWRR
ncbi:MULTISPECIES: fatty acid desaturase [Actibacterium]|uniref:Fatty acid desaturase n=1 Tax=Actibacterium naphthalenivorans TaxID=1614693 RepID=A0A840C506_9RHOB|nr:MULTISPECIES: fatty acid desaturase [Actibacterium]ALG89373.1 fatty acid desaturase [Actibacterium sp. EMB200-NS6]MBB4021011.1 fatty acid desaturase [Actibacterium naphthalenivorans]